MNKEPDAKKTRARTGDTSTCRSYHNLAGGVLYTLDHAIECAYAIRHQPISDALASKSIALLLEHLPASIRTKGDESVAHRGYCLTE